jgi:hypothetical protein
VCIVFCVQEQSTDEFFSSGMPNRVRLEIPSLPQQLPRALYCASSFSISAASVYSADVIMRRVCIFESTSIQHVACFTARVRGDQPSFGMLCMAVIELGRGLTDINVPRVYLYEVRYFYLYYFGFFQTEFQSVHSLQERPEWLDTSCTGACDEVQCQFPITNGDQVMTDMLPNLWNTFGKTYALYVGVATLGIGDAVTWSVDIEVFTRLERASIRVIY